MSLNLEIRYLRVPALLRTTTLLIAALFVQQVSAHAVGLSRGEYRLSGSTLNADIIFARPEMMALIDSLDANADHELDNEELKSGQTALAALIVPGLSVSNNQQVCTGSLLSSELTESDGLALHLQYQCQNPVDDLQLNMKLLSTLPQGHRHLVSWPQARNADPASANSPVQTEAGTQIVFEAQPRFQAPAALMSQSNRVGTGTENKELIAFPLFKMGIEHILTGYDHLLFLFGVILIGGRWRSLILAISAFTLAHSITLGIAALNIYVPSSRFIEPMIALSIAYVGIENWFAKDASRRWMLTFPFGLIHGFGFAGALQEIALPHSQIPMALLSFNAGVESGQLLVLAAVTPLLLWLRRQPWFTRVGIPTLNTFIALAGVSWFIARIA